MTKMNNQITSHHKIAKELGGSNYGANLESKPRGEHNAHHILFDNKPPHEQLSTIVDSTGRCFRQKFRDEIMSVLQDYEIQDIYHPKCVNLQKMIRIMNEKILENNK